MCLLGQKHLYCFLLPLLLLGVVLGPQLEPAHIIACVLRAQHPTRYSDNFGELLAADSSVRNGLGKDYGGTHTRYQWQCPSSNRSLLPWALFLTTPLWGNRSCTLWFRKAPHRYFYIVLSDRQSQESVLHYGLLLPASISSLTSIRQCSPKLSTSSFRGFWHIANLPWRVVLFLWKLLLCTILQVLITIVGSYLKYM